MRVDGDGIDRAGIGSGGGGGGWISSPPKPLQVNSLLVSVPHPLLHHHAPLPSSVRLTFTLLRRSDERVSGVAPSPSSSDLCTQEIIRAKEEEERVQFTSLRSALTALCVCVKQLGRDVGRLQCTVELAACGNKDTPHIRRALQDWITLQDGPSESSKLRYGQIRRPRGPFGGEA